MLYPFSPMWHPLFGIRTASHSVLHASCNAATSLIAEFFSTLLITVFMCCYIFQGFFFFWYYLFSLFLTESCFHLACLFLMSAFLCLSRLFSIEFTVQDRQVMAVSCPFMPVPRTLDLYSTVRVLFWDKAGRSAALLFSEQLLIQGLWAPWRKGEEKMKRGEARDVNWGEQNPNICSEMELTCLVYVRSSSFSKPT